MKALPKPPSLPERPEVAFHKGRATELEIRYNELLASYQKLERQVKARDRYIVRMHFRRVGLLYWIAACTAFGIVSLVIRWR